MHRNILLSICIPTYNRADYLDTCIKSIMHYTKDDIEILIQDNDSPDNTGEIVEKYNKDKRISYIKNPTNIGVVKNIWTLIGRAQGQYIVFLTDDDYFLPGGIEKLLTFITDTSPVCFKSNLIIYFEKSKEACACKLKNPNSLPELFLFAHILTGLCFKKDALSAKDTSHILSNMYPSEAIMGLLIENATYLDEPIAVHIWENEVFWGSEMMPASENIIKEEQALISALKRSMPENIYNEIIKYYMLDTKNWVREFACLLTFREKLSIRKSIIIAKIKQKIIKLAKKILKP